MKPFFALIAGLFSLFVPSCITNPRCRTRQLAIENECYSLLNFMVQYYDHAYYSLPKDAESLLSFAERWKAIDSCFVYYEDIYGMKLSDFSSRSMNFAYYGDSIFIYTETLNEIIGCCAYGTPFYWWAHPERYDPFRRDFYDCFRPSAYRENGDYLFEEEFDYKELSSLIDSLYARYDSVVTYNGYYFDGFSEIPHNQQVLFLSIVSFEPDRDIMEVLTPVLPIDSLQVYSTTRGTYRPMRDALDVECKEYLNGIMALFKNNTHSNKDVARILLGIRWCCNDSPSVSCKNP